VLAGRLDPSPVLDLTVDLDGSGTHTKVNTKFSGSMADRTLASSLGLVVAFWLPSAPKAWRAAPRKILLRSSLLATHPGAKTRYTLERHRDFWKSAAAAAAHGLVHRLGSDLFTGLLCASQRSVLSARRGEAEVIHNLILGSVW
jgi:hypothetical protein